MVHQTNKNYYFNHFKYQIVNDNIVFIKMINENYIDNIFKSSYYYFLKNQLKLIINSFKIILLSIKKNIFVKFNNNEKVVFLSLSQNNYATFFYLKKYYNIDGKIISYNSYENENSSLLLIDLLNTFFAVFLHIIFFPLIPFIFQKYKKRFFIYSDEIAKSIISIFTIRLINMKNLNEIMISNDHNYFSRQFVKRAKLFNNKTMFITHGQPSETYPEPITDHIFVDNSISKLFFINQFNINPNKISIIGYPKLYNYKFNHEEYDFGVCSTPSMDKDDILFILQLLSKKYKILFRPHPSLITYNSYYSNKSIEFSNPIVDDIKLFFQRSKKIITGNSGILFESLFLKKTTFLWAENVKNKFGLINDKDRYGVLKNNYCLELNSENIEETVIKDHRLSDEQYNMLFPIGLNEKNEKLFIFKDKGIK